MKQASFAPTNWFTKHTTAAYFLIILLSCVGTFIFSRLPKEKFPDIVLPKIFVVTVDAGSSPRDIENLITKPLEKEISAMGGGAKVKKISSISAQDISTIIVEFESKVPIGLAREQVKTAIDRARANLPEKLTKEPMVNEVNFSDLPVMYMHLSGGKDGLLMKAHAKRIKDKLETITEISKVEIVGALERVVQINVDKYKMEFAGISLKDIEDAVSRENLNIGIGTLKTEEMQRHIHMRGSFQSLADLRQVVIQNIHGAPIYLRDIAEIKDGTADTISYSRLNSKPVVTLNILKKSGANLLDLSEKVHKILQEEQQILPKDIKLSISGDTSKQTEHSFNELINSIVLGFLLVLLILMFFMGLSTAFFVALSVPLSVFVTFLALPLGNFIIGTNITLNFIVLFALLFALGIIVDDAIVVIENAHRIFHSQKISVLRAIQLAAAEVFWPVLSGTLTTLAPFFPLLFWQGIVGKFMIYLPVILIFTLSASLVVAFLMNPVFALSSIRNSEKSKSLLRQAWFWIGLGIAIILDFTKHNFWGNLILITLAFLYLHQIVFIHLIRQFQSHFLPRLMRAYDRLLRFSLQGLRPVWYLCGMVLLLALAILTIWLRVPANKIFFFPRNENPNKIAIYLDLPVGTRLAHTDSLAKMVEKRVLQLFQDKPNLVSSVISNVASGVADPMQGGIDNGNAPHKAVINISFQEAKLRHGASTGIYVDSLREILNFIRGATWSVEAERIGPPTGAPVNIELAGEDYTELLNTAMELKKYLGQRIEGIEDLRMDIDTKVPEMQLNIDRERANAQGLSSAQIASELRTAILGKEISQYRGEQEDYPIILRFKNQQRQHIEEVLNTYLTYRMHNGQPTSVPLSAFVKTDYQHSYNIIKHQNSKRTVTLQANLLNGYSVTSVNNDIARALAEFSPQTQIQIRQTGETEEQKATTNFLALALLVTLGIMLTILIIQFNSLSKPIIILTEILFSFIGVLFGFGFSKMDIPTIMVGVGMVGLAGIVVKNAILLIEFTDELRARGYKLREAIVQAGKARITPVLLTTLSAVGSLFPLALGFNIDLYSLLENGRAGIFFGGDSVVFWGPLAWTLIFGLIFAFLLTLVLVPAMYLLAFRLKRPLVKFYGSKWVALTILIPPIFFFLLLTTFVVRRLQGQKLFLTIKTRPSPKKI